MKILKGQTSTEEEEVTVVCSKFDTDISDVRCQFFGHFDVVLHSFHGLGLIREEIVVDYHLLSLGSYLTDQPIHLSPLSVPNDLRLALALHCALYFIVDGCQATQKVVDCQLVVLILLVF